MTRVVRPMGDRALLARCSPEEVTALLAAVDAAAADGRLPGIEDVVPAARSLLVRLAPDADPTGAAATLATLPLTVAARTVTETVHIEVHYDGADLDDVADRAGLTRAEVVEIHATATYSVAFCGFAPGFAYLTGLDPRLQVPRLDTPRTRVPAGSVAVAAEYAAVYPRSSPGGWRLLGRTQRALFDADRSPPALLAPGHRVRFVPVGRVR